MEAAPLRGDLVRRHRGVGCADDVPGSVYRELAAGILLQAMSTFQKEAVKEAMRMRTSKESDGLHGSKRRQIVAFDRWWSTFHGGIGTSLVTHDLFTGERYAEYQ